MSGVKLYKIANISPNSLPMTPRGVVKKEQNVRLMQVKNGLFTRKSCMFQKIVLILQHLKSTFIHTIFS